jgi:hypothetical protein
MEALSVDDIPTGAGWQYEPKWDGFRCLTFRDGSKVELQSKSGRPLTRYFPELVDALRKVDAETFALDGEIAVPHDGSFSFDALLQRIHPAPSRIKRSFTTTHSSPVPGSHDMPTGLRKPEANTRDRPSAGSISRIAELIRGLRANHGHLVPERRSFRPSGG